MCLGARLPVGYITNVVAGDVIGHDATFLDPDPVGAVATVGKWREPYAAYVRLSGKSTARTLKWRDS